MKLFKIVYSLCLLSLIGCASARVPASNGASGRLVHFSIPVKNLETSLKFYTDLLGWKFKVMTPTYWMIEDSLGALSLETEAVSGTMPILYFGVSNIDEALSKAKALGATIVLRKMDSGDGFSYFATIRDLNGNVIGLWSK